MTSECLWVLLIAVLSYYEEDKLVDIPLLENLGFGDAARHSGFELRWVTF